MIKSRGIVQLRNTRKLVVTSTSLTQRKCRPLCGDVRNNAGRKGLLRPISTISSYFQQVVPGGEREDTSLGLKSLSTKPPPPIQIRSIWSSMFPGFFTSSDKDDDKDEDKKNTKPDSDGEIRDLGAYNLVRDYVSLLQRLSQQPGSCDHETWTEAIGILRALIEKNEGTSPRSVEKLLQIIDSETDGEDDDDEEDNSNEKYRQRRKHFVYNAFQLLDRLVKEPHASQYLTTDIIGLIMDRWFEVYQERQAMREKYKEELRTRNSLRGAEINWRQVYGRIPVPTSIWGRLDTYQQSYNIELDTRICHTMIKAITLAGSSNFVKTDPMKYPRIAHSILDRMIQLSSKEGKNDNPLIRPSAQTFDLVLTAYNRALGSRLVQTQSIKQCLLLLEQLKSYYLSGWGDDYLPDAGIYKKVMNPIAHTGNGPKVEQLLEDLFDFYYVETNEKFPSLLQPKLQHFTQVLIAYSKYHIYANEQRKLRKRRQHQDQQEDELHDEQNDGINEYDNYAVDNSNSKGGTRNKYFEPADALYAAERATLILQRMIELEKVSMAGGEARNGSELEEGENVDDYDESLPKLNFFKVYPANFNIVMTCWLKVNSKEAAFKVEEIYQQMLDLYKNDPLTKRPNDSTFFQLVLSWNFFDPEKAEEHFWKWKSEYDDGYCVGLSETTRASPFDKIVGGYYRRCAGFTTGRGTESPPELTAKQQKDIMFCAERCESLFRHVLEPPEDGSDKDVNDLWKPTGVGFSMVISSWTRKKTVEGTEHAESMLLELEDYIHNKLNSEGSKEKSKSSPWMKSLNINQTFVMTYMPVIHGWAALGDPERAEHFLYRWFERYDNVKLEDSSQPRLAARRFGGRKHEILDYGTFKKVLNAWSSKAATDPIAADRAEALLLSMRKYGIPPHHTIFQAVLEIRKIAHENGLAPETSPRVDELIEFLDEMSKGRSNRYRHPGMSSASNNYNHNVRGRGKSNRRQNQQRNDRARAKQFADLRNDFARAGGHR